MSEVIRQPSEAQMRYEASRLDIGGMGHAVSRHTTLGAAIESLIAGWDDYEADEESDSAVVWDSDLKRPVADIYDVPAFPHGLMLVICEIGKEPRVHMAV